MNGMKPRFLEGEALADSYYETPNPYKSPSKTRLNLLEMSRYAEKQGKKLAELSKEEVKKFEI